jgi:1,4-dihydroxy-2-naphthoate polyprenyltransferase
MRVNQVVSLTEPQTKLASVLPFLFGIAFTLYRYGTFDPAVLAVFFVSFFFIDIGTTSLNNYKDWKRECASGLGRDVEKAYNPITRTGMSGRDARAVMVTLFAIGCLAGLALVCMTDPLILLIGLAAFLVAVTYSAGPVPISHTPAGEFFSGVTMGGGITFVTVYAQVHGSGFVNFMLDWPKLAASANLAELAVIVLVSLPYIFLIANIMLANNICDMDVDRTLGRRTLPIVVGRWLASAVFIKLLALSYIAVVVAVALKVLPVAALASLLTLPVTVKGTVRLLRNPDKFKNFSVSVINLLLIGGVLALSVFAHMAVTVIFAV